MAWFKFDHALPEKPEVLEIARKLDVPRAHVIGALCLVWRWFSEQSQDGTIASRDCHVTVTDVSGLPGLGEAMEAVGWLSTGPESMSMPGFERWLGSAKDARRQQEKRNRDRKNGLSRDNHVTVTQSSVTITPQNQTQNQNQNQTEEPPCLTAGSPLPPAAPAPGPDPSKKIRPTKKPKPPKPEDPGPTAAEVPALLHTADFLALWPEWIGHRARNDPMTKRAAEMALRELAEWGPVRACLALRNSLQHPKWTSIYEPHHHNGHELPREKTHQEVLREIGLL